MPRVFLTVIFFSLFELNLSPLSAQSPSIKSVFNKDVFIANAAFTLTGTRDYASYLEINYLNELYAQAPSSKANVMQSQVNALTQELKEFGQSLIAEKSLSGYVHALKDSVIKISSRAGGNQGTVLRSAAFIRSIYRLPVPPNDLTAGVPNAGNGGDFDKTLGNSILARAFDNAAVSGNFNASFTLLFSGKINGTKPSDPYDKILQDNPTFANSFPVRNFVVQFGQPNASLPGVNDLSAAFTSLTDLMVGQMDASNALLTRFSAKTSFDPESQSLQRQEQLSSDEIMDGITLLADLGNVTVGKDFGDQLLGTGKNFLTITKSIENFKYLSTQAGAISLGGSIMLSSNLLGAALNIFQLFSKPDNVEQKILKELKAVSSQIDTLYKQMQSRFNKVDFELAEVYNEIQTGFRIIQTDLSQINNEIIQIQNTLNTIESKLDNYSIVIYNQIAQQKYDQLYLALGRINGPSLSNDSYGNILDDLHTYGSVLALENPYSGLDYTDNVSLNKFLVNAPNYSAFTLLNNILGQKYGLVLSAAALPDIKMWTLAAGGLLQLSDAYPNNPVPQQYLDDVIAAGQQMLDFQDDLKFSMLNGSRNSRYAIFDTLIDNYKRNAHRFIKDDYLNVENKYLKDKFNGLNPFKDYPDGMLTKAVNIDMDDIVALRWKYNSPLMPSFYYSGETTVFPDFHVRFTDSMVLYKLLPHYYRWLSTLNLTKDSMAINFNYNNIHAQGPGDPPNDLDMTATQSTFITGQSVVNYKMDIDFVLHTIPIRFLLPLTSTQWSSFLNQAGVGFDYRLPYVSKPLRFETVTTQTLQPPGIRTQQPSIIGQEIVSNFYSGTDIEADLQNVIAGLSKATTDSFFTFDAFSWQWCFQMVNNARKSIFQNNLQQFSGGANLDDVTPLVDFYNNTIRAALQIAFPRSAKQDDSLISFLDGDSCLISKVNFVNRLNEAIAAINGFTDTCYPSTRGYSTPADWENGILTTVHNYNWWDRFERADLGKYIEVFRPNVNHIQAQLDSVIATYYTDWDADIDRRIEQFRTYVHHRIDEAVVQDEPIDEVAAIVQNLKLLKALKVAK